MIGSSWIQSSSMSGYHNFSLVINDTTLQIVLTRILIEKLDAKKVDVKTVFLYGDLDQTINMKIPDGYQGMYWKCYTG